MKKLLWLCALLVPATAFAGGVDLSWVDCNPTGVSNQNFVCTGTSNKTYSLHLQFKIDQDLPAFVGMAMFLDLQSEQPGNLSKFWQFEETGCQRTQAIPGISFSDDIPTAIDCENLADPWGTVGLGFDGIAAFASDFYRPGNGHFVCGSALAASTGITGGINYWAAVLSFTNRHRVTCAPGCDERAVIVWNLGILESNNGDLPVNLGLADKGSNCAMINGGTQGTCDVTPTRNTSWGQIKSLYR